MARMREPVFLRCIHGRMRKRALWTMRRKLLRRRAGPANGIVTWLDFPGTGTEAEQRGGLDLEQRHATTHILGLTVGARPVQAHTDRTREPAAAQRRADREQPVNGLDAGRREIPGAVAHLLRRGAAQAITGAQRRRRMWGRLLVRANLQRLDLLAREHSGGGRPELVSHQLSDTYQARRADAAEGPIALQSLSFFRQPVLDLATGFDHPVPRHDAPPDAVPGDLLGDARQVPDRQVREQHPSDRLDSWEAFHLRHRDHVHRERFGRRQLTERVEKARMSRVISARRLPVGARTNQLPRPLLFGLREKFEEIRFPLRHRDGLHARHPMRTRLVQAHQPLGAFETPLNGCEMLRALCGINSSISYSCS